MQVHPFKELGNFVEISVDAAAKIFNEHEIELKSAFKNLIEDPIVGEISLSHGIGGVTGLCIKSATNDIPGCVTPIHVTDAWIVLAFSADGDDAREFVRMGHAKIKCRIGSDSMSGKKDTVGIDAESSSCVAQRFDDCNVG